MLKILPIPCLIDPSLCLHAFYPLRQFVFMPLVPTLMMLRRNRKAKCCLRLERGGESAGLDLLIPFADPFVRAKGSESLLELLARSKLLTLGVDTLVVVNKVLPTVLGLVLVRESGVKASSLEHESLVVGHFAVY